MTLEGSISRLLDPLRAGDEDAARALWERYFPRLVGLARASLRGAPRVHGEAEDVALSAFESFCNAAEKGRYPDLGDREGLWRLLMTITLRKASHLKRDRGREKHGGGHAFVGEEALAEAPGKDLDPALAAELAEQFSQLLERLGDPELRSIAVWRMEGYSVEEIAARVGYVGRTVKRKLSLIRTIWEADEADE